jgi:hypothetical protein
MDQPKTYYTPDAPIVDWRPTIDFGQPIIFFYIVLCKCTIYTL